MLLLVLAREPLARQSEGSLRDQERSAVSVKGRDVEHAEHLERDRLWRSVLYYAGKR